MGIVRVFWPGRGACYECTLTDLDYQMINLRYSCPLLKREDAVREYRGGGWERVVEDVAQTDLEADLLDYEARRRADREKLDAMIAYCRTARCRTAHVMAFFGQEPGEEHRCGHCDNCGSLTMASGSLRSHQAR
mgnify:CR=1 FL=1